MDRRRAHHNTRPLLVLLHKSGALLGWWHRCLGSSPPDTHVWILGGDAPAFVKLEDGLRPALPTCNPMRVIRCSLKLGSFGGSCWTGWGVEEFGL
jgi:hypothetical protein